MNIPTVEEFLIKERECVKDGKFFDFVEKEDLIEFAKLHVEAALKEASEKAETKDYDQYQYGGGYITIQEIDKQSILNSYSLTNIK